MHTGVEVTDNEVGVVMMELSSSANRFDELYPQLRETKELFLLLNESQDQLVARNSLKSFVTC